MKNFVVKTIAFSISITLLMPGEVHGAVSKYPKITAGDLIAQIDEQGKNFDKLKLITNGFADDFRVIDNNLYKLIDLFITTNEVNQVKESLISKVYNIVADYNNLYKKYLYAAANDEHISSGRQIKNLDETSIVLRKNVLEELGTEIGKLLSKNKNFVRDTKAKLDNLQNSDSPAGVLRYRESINVLRSLNNLLEKLINRVGNIQDQLKANAESRQS